MSGPLAGHTTWSLDAGWTGNAVDEYGVLWKVTKDVGWAAAPAPRVERTPRVSTDGVHPARSTRDARLIVLEGKAEAPDAASRDAAIDRFTALFAGGRGQVLTVADQHLTRHAYVELDGEPSTDALSTRVFTWSIRMLAPDPLKYGPEQVASVGLPTRGSATGVLFPLAFPLDYGVTSGASAGELLLGNPGRAAYHPRLRIDGPVTNPRVWMVETGAEVRLGMTVPVDQYVDLLLRDRRVLLQGVASRRFAVTYAGDWLAVPPGGGTLRWEADSFDDRATLWAWAPDGAWL